ncbi:MAG TPA: site-2 protease family protein, partial [Candidatus Sulfotelmatobacter sp.]|nr:site-2 protease family protein [Candidatus Sulfotelmatobacter sp.]
MRSWSIPVGRLFGVEVRLHLTFFILPVFIFWTQYAANQASANGPRDMALVGLILACVAAHECGHMLAARRYGLIPKAVILLPLTGVALYDESRVDKTQLGGVWKRDIRLALIGPFVSLALAGLSAAVISVVGGIELWKWPFLQAANLPRSLVWANLYLALFNLMPAYPLDGGRVLRAFLARTLDASSATRRAVSISNAIAMVLMLAGLFSDSWLTMVGVIVFSAAQLEERALVFQSVLDNVRLEEVMLTDFA